MSPTEILADRVASSGVGFGTSGARGQVTAMTDLVCYQYTRAFLQWSEAAGLSPHGSPVAIAGDLRPSTGRILAAVAAAIEDAGGEVRYYGRIPTPALLLQAMALGWPSLMVTGSHIPFDRNGIKFHRPDGEILKADEQAMLAQTLPVTERGFDQAGALLDPPNLGEADSEAATRYRERWTGAFPNALSGKHILFYQHSGVGRDLLVEILEALGARVTPTGRVDKFVPIDTEAVAEGDRARARQWIAEYGADAIVSTDGDADRPMLADETGEWFRGDDLGALCGRFLRADAVVTPVSSNTSVERGDWFAQVRRTRIGSPYVIEAMQAAQAEGASRVMGYEANGGALLQQDIQVGAGLLAALPSRDAMLGIVSLLVEAAQRGVPLSGLRADLPARFTASDRVQGVATEASRAMIAELAGHKPGSEHPLTGMRPALGGLEAVDQTDGLRMTFASGDIIHLRPSGNAPELRCYAEADDAGRAGELVEQTLAWARARVG